MRLVKNIGSGAGAGIFPGDDAAALGSGSATDTQVLTADGAGNATWEDGGGVSPGDNVTVLGSGAEDDGAIPKADGEGNLEFVTPEFFKTYTAQGNLAPGESLYMNRAALSDVSQFRINVMELIPGAERTTADLTETMNAARWGMANLAVEDDYYFVSENANNTGRIISHSGHLDVESIGADDKIYLPASYGDVSAAITALSGSDLYIIGSDDNSDEPFEIDDGEYTGGQTIINVLSSTDAETTEGMQLVIREGYVSLGAGNDLPDVVEGVVCKMTNEGNTVSMVITEITGAGEGVDGVTLDGSVTLSEIATRITSVVPIIFDAGDLHLSQTEAIDEYTSGLYHCDGANGSTNLVATVGPAGTCVNCELTTADKMYGTACADIDQSGDKAYISIPNAALDLSGKFAVEFPIKISSDTTFQSMWLQYDFVTDTGIYIYYDHNDNRVEAWGKLNGNWEFSLTGTTDIADNDWHWIKLARDDTPSAYLHIDGTLEDSGYAVGTMNDISTSEANIIGANPNQALDLTGLVDEIRCSTTERQTGNYTPARFGTYAMPDKYFAMTLNDGNLCDHWTDFFGISLADEVSADALARYAISFDDGETWKVFDGSAWREIARDNSGTWQYRDGGDDSWNDATENTEYSALSEAMESGGDNEWTSIDVNSLADSVWKLTGAWDEDVNEVKLAIGLKTTNAGVTPVVTHIAFSVEVDGVYKKIHTGYELDNAYEVAPGEGFTTIVTRRLADGYSGARDTGAAPVAVSLWIPDQI